jgi:O-antigen/teichoic acid export membrane protein
VEKTTNTKIIGEKMRTKNFIKIFFSAVVYELIISVFQVIIPRFVIITYGSAVNGLSSSISQILLMVGLIQAGSVGASIFALYKPVAEKDYATVSSILYSSRKYYKKIGFLFCTVSVIVAIASSFKLTNGDINQTEVIIAFLLMILASAFSFFSFSYYDILFSSFQQRFWLSIGNLIEKLVYYFLLIIVLVTRTHFLLMFAVVICGTIAKAIFYIIVFKKKYNSIIDPNPINPNFPIKNRQYLLLSMIADQAISYTPTVIIAFIFGLDTASVYAVYAIVISAINTLVNAVQLSMSAIFGNLVASEDGDKVKKVFNVVVYLFTLIGTYLASCVAFLIMPFISIYTNGIDDVNYFFSAMAILVPIYTAVYCLRTPYGFVATVYGLFKDLCYISVVSSCIGIVIAIVLASFFGMPYVLVGIISYYLLSGIMIIIALKKKIPWIDLKRLSLRATFLCSILIFSIVISGEISVNFSEITSWILGAIVFSLFLGIIFIAYSLVFERNEMRDVVNYGKAFLSKQKSK